MDITLLFRWQQQNSKGRTWYIADDATSQFLVLTLRESLNEGPTLEIKKFISYAELADSIDPAIQVNDHTRKAIKELEKKIENSATRPARSL